MVRASRAQNNAFQVLKGNNYQARILHSAKLPIINKGKKKFLLHNKNRLKEFVSTNLALENTLGGISGQRIHKAQGRIACARTIEKLGEERKELQNYCSIRSQPTLLNNSCVYQWPQLHNQKAQTNRLKRKVGILYLLPPRKQAHLTPKHRQCLTVRGKVFYANGPRK